MEIFFPSIVSSTSAFLRAVDVKLLEHPNADVFLAERATDQKLFGLIVTAARIEEVGGRQWESAEGR